jgi:hypothetical protein
VETIQIGNLSFVVAPKETVTKRRNNNSSSVSRSRRKPKPQAKRILTIASRHGWDSVRKVGNGGLINQPVMTNGWLVMPIEMYKNIIPPEGIQQAKILTKGIDIKGLLIADDQRNYERQSQKKSLPEWGKIATGFGKLAAVIALGTAVISFFPIVLGVGAIGAALAYDPLLIAVTTEDEWICLYEWWH